MIAAAGLGAEDRLLEIGCATGKATLPLARKGFRLTCVEPGPSLAAVGRRNLADFPTVEVVQSTFESIDPSEHEPLDLVFAATSWHWLDPAVRYRRSWELLLPGGHLAFWSATHASRRAGTLSSPNCSRSSTRSAKARLRERHAPGRASCPTSARIEASGLFESVLVRDFDWEVTYDAEGYLRLLDTFSGHIAMQPWQRRRAVLGGPAPAGTASRRVAPPWLGRRREATGPPARAVGRSTPGTVLARSTAAAHA